MESKHEFSESVQSAISQIKTSNKLSKKLTSKKESTIPNEISDDVFEIHDPNLVQQDGPKGFSD